MKDFFFSGCQNAQIHCLEFEPKTKKIKGVVVVVHGMQEHVYRYEHFASFLAENGYIVYVPELRGHGKNIEQNIPGFCQDDLFLTALEDCKILTKSIKTAVPDLPIFVLGHSFGSFIAQRWILENENVDKFILSGSTYTKTLLMAMGGVIANLACFFKGEESEAKLVEAMSIRGYGKKFKNKNWLSRDENVWEKYQKDALCGLVFPNGFYRSMFRNVRKNYKGLSRVRKVPLLLIGGTEDPVSGFSKGLKRLFEEYEKCGFNVKLKLYPQSRHEVLNEVDKEVVYSDVLMFLKEV